ncbi:MAG: hypothetical protein AAF485_10740 [Chloroflexota bacterium]
MSSSELKHRRTRKKQDNEGRDEKRGTDTPNQTGLNSLQQQVGNRAVQRMLNVEQAQAFQQQRRALAAKVAARRRRNSQEEEETDQLAAVEAAFQQEQSEEQEAALVMEEQALIAELASYQIATQSEVVVGEEQEADDVVSQADHELLSGERWVDQFPASDKLNDLDSSFSSAVTRFITALETAGASIDILATRWPPERAYLMHWAWLIANDEVDAREVPPVEEVEFDTSVSPSVDIIWWHGNEDESKKAAEEMIKAFGIDELEKPPPLESKHVSGQAIDMRVSWGGNGLIVEIPGGDQIELDSAPQDERNPQLAELGLIFGVIHYGDIDDDAVHWSVDGS